MSSPDQDKPDSPNPQQDEATHDERAEPEHLNIKVTDNQNEVFFKIKKTTKLEKLMHAFCERQGKSLATVRFLFDGQRVQPEDTPSDVSLDHHMSFIMRKPSILEL